MPKKLEKAEKKDKKLKKDEPSLEKEKEVAEPEKQTPKRVVEPNSILDLIKDNFKKNNSISGENGFGDTFFESDLFNVSQEDQNEYFNLIKNLFANINVQKPKMALQSYIDSYYELFELITEMAVCGCVPAMDYLCFIYKKGVEDFMPVNLTRAHEWGLLATANGSKLSPERMRLFLEPVYQYITENNLVGPIMDKFYTENDDELINYIAYNFANIFNEKFGLTLGAMSKKKLIATESFQVFLKNTSKVINDCLPLLAKYIA